MYQIKTSRRRATSIVHEKRPGVPDVVQIPCTRHTRPVSMDLISPNICDLQVTLNPSPSTRAIPAETNQAPNSSYP